MLAWRMTWIICFSILSILDSAYCLYANSSFSSFKLSLNHVSHKLEIKRFFSFGMILNTMHSQTNWTEGYYGGDERLQQMTIHKAHKAVQLFTRGLQYPHPMITVPMPVPERPASSQPNSAEFSLKCHMTRESFFHLCWTDKNERILLPSS